MLQLVLFPQVNLSYCHCCSILSVIQIELQMTIHQFLSHHSEMAICLLDIWDSWRCYLIENNVLYLTIHKPPAPIEQVVGCSGYRGDTRWTCICLRRSSNAVWQPITPEPTTSTFILERETINRVRKIVCVMYYQYCSYTAINTASNDWMKTNDDFKRQ